MIDRVIVESATEPVTYTVGSLNVVKIEWVEEKLIAVYIKGASSRIARYYPYHRVISWTVRDVKDWPLELEFSDDDEKN